MEKEKRTDKEVGYTSIQTRTTPNPYSDIAHIENGKFQFNFLNSIRWIEALGKKKFGQHFRIYPEDHSLLLTLLVYAIQDEELAIKKKLNLQKGILLTGPIGCGKTSLMTLIKYFFPQNMQYQLKSSREIGFEFEKEGFKVINRYGSEILSNPLLRIRFCFDDLGVEQAHKHFGNSCDVMGEVLLSRYELFVSKGIFTHVTTNLSASEIEQRYGNRVRSRMREMFNLVAFDKASMDKRK